MTARTTALSLGRVVYYDGASILGYANLNRSGKAELETRVLRPGAHFIRAMVLGRPDIAARGATVLVAARAAAGSENTGIWESTRVSDGGVRLGSDVVFAVAPQATATGDFNEDGHLDLLVATTSGLAVLAGNGNGEVGNPTWVVQFAQPVTSITGLVVSDFNEDGHPDVAVGVDGGINIYFGDGKGGLSGLVRYADASLPVGEPLGDLNGDRHADLLAIDSKGALRVLLGTGAGGFYPRPLELPGLVRAGADSEVRVADRTGAGFVDSIIVGSQRWRRDSQTGLFTVVRADGFSRESNSTVALRTVQPSKAPENMLLVRTFAVPSSPAVVTPAGAAVITYTCDATINAVAGVCGTLNTTIASVYSSAFTNANANLYITFGDTGLGSSESALTAISYGAFRAALVAAETDADDVTAVTNSVPVSNPFGSADVVITNPSAQALGIAPSGGVTPSGSLCALGPPGCYDGIITISSSIQAAGGLYYRIGSIKSGQYDFYTVVEHETDEVLGTASCVFGCGSSIAPADLFRYHSSGTRSFAGGNNNSCASRNTANACFSIDGVNMLQQYNNLNNGEDGGDWAPNCALPQVQNSEACPGVAGVNIAPDAEIKVLDVVGFAATHSTLTIGKAHTGSFTQGQMGAIYTITVTNRGTASTNGTVTVVDTAPSGLTLVSMNGGATWNCATLPACTTSNVLNSGSSYPAITVTVNVAVNASSPQVNAAGATGGGSAAANTTDPTIILAPPAAPVLTSPANAATNVSLTASLNWNAASGAISYDVYLGTSPAPPFAANTVATTYSPGTLNVSTTYYWKVVAKNNDGSAGSAVWSFTTRASGTSGTLNFIGKFVNTTDLGNSAMFETNGFAGIATTQPAISLDVRTGSLPQMGIAGLTDYLTFFASDQFGPAIYWDPAKDMRFGKGGSGLYNAFGFVERMRIQSSSGSVGIGTMTPGSKLDLTGDINFTGSVRYQGSPALQMPGGVSADNLVLGFGAMPDRTTGTSDTAVGASPLASTTTGNENTATGRSALANNANGNSNTASGASGLLRNTKGNNNTAIGYQALASNTTGNSNIAIGSNAAINVSGANSDNIHVGSLGFSADSGAIRLGDSSAQSSFFVAGVRGAVTGGNDAVPVVIDSAGQLGTVSSSRRFKEDVQEMGAAGLGLMRLRPVTFRYKQPFADGSKPIQYGLIAEEVAEVYPDLVVHSADRRIETVKYQVLGAMLLNGLQRQQAEIVLLEQEVDEQEQQNENLQERLVKLEAKLALKPHVKTPGVQ